MRLRTVRLKIQISFSRGFTPNSSEEALKKAGVKRGLCVFYSHVPVPASNFLACLISGFPAADGDGLLL